MSLKKGDFVTFNGGPEVRTSLSKGSLGIVVELEKSDPSLIYQASKNRCKVYWIKKTQTLSMSRDYISLWEGWKDDQ